jgi:hypothetical protein
MTPKKSNSPLQKDNMLTKTPRAPYSQSMSPLSSSSVASNRTREAKKPKPPTRCPSSLAGRAKSNPDEDEEEEDEDPKPPTRRPNSLAGPRAKSNPDEDEEEEDEEPEEYDSPEEDEEVNYPLPPHLAASARKRTASGSHGSTRKMHIQFNRRNMSRKTHSSSSRQGSTPSDQVSKLLICCQ